MLTLNWLSKEAVIKHKKDVLFRFYKNYIRNVVIKNRSHSPISEVVLLSRFTYLVKKLRILTLHESWPCIHNNVSTINAKQPYTLMQTRGL